MRASNQRGFSLMELLIAMMIIGVLTAVVSVNFGRGNKVNDLRHVATVLEQKIRLAQGYSTGGNSINYCNSTATDNMYGRCVDDGACGGVPKACTNGVPPGGYGISISSVYEYRLFANTNNTLAHQDPLDPDILLTDNSEELIGVVSYKLGTLVLDPSIYKLDVVFAAPKGTISFFSSDSLSTEVQLELLIESSFLPENCKRITINRISGLISQEASECSL